MSDISNILSSLFIGKGQRVLDLKGEYSGYTEAQISNALEDAVTSGLAEKYMLQGETFYLKKI